MELLVLIILGLPVGFAIWIAVRISRAASQIEHLNFQVDRIQHDVYKLKEQLKSSPGMAPEPTEIPEPKVVIHSEEAELAPVIHQIEEIRHSGPSQSEQIQPIFEPQTQQSEELPPVMPAFSPLLPASPPSEKEPTFFDKLSSGTINWEQFVGVNLLMWLGGLAAFLTVVFAIKYSFDRNWITPELRVAAGFLIGVGLLISGVILHRRKKYRVGAQTFCATGIVILYATTFACRSIYHFEFFSTIPAFVLMVLITSVAFVLSVRLDALVVAILGICGGFMTPILLSTGQDNPLGLFGYILFLDLGLIAVACRKQWNFLTLMGACGTLLMQVGWINEFFEREMYFEQNKFLIALAVFLTFSALFVAVWTWIRKRQEGNIWITISTIAMSSVALLFTFYLFDFPPIGARPEIIFTYVLLVDFCLLALAWMDKKLVSIQLAAGAAVFLLLAYWTGKHLSTDLLYYGLGSYFLFAVLHAAIPFVQRQFQPGATPHWWGHIFPPVALLLMLAPMIKLNTATMALWPFVLLLDVAVFIFAILSASMIWVILALVLTLFAAGCWIKIAPAQLAYLPEELAIIGVFALLFFAAGIYAVKYFRAQRTEESASANTNDQPDFSSNAMMQLPALSAVLPFALLIMVVQRLPLADPSPVFGLALALVCLILGLSRVFPMSWLPAVGLGCILALEHSWHFRLFTPAAPVMPLLWYLGFAILFQAFPFLFWRQLKEHIVPWIAAALAGPLHFYLVHRLVKSAWPCDYMGLLPIAFAVPCMFSLVFLIRSIASNHPQRNNLLALFGAAALFFITLIFPIQFDRQWITIGWALEGAALLWLFHRVPHSGLRLAGVGLLVVSFIRLALNPAVLEYHVRAATPIFNWYLYAYGITTACLFAGAWLMAPPRHRIMDSDARSILASLGTVLAFILLNIEIADYFAETGAVKLTFEFSGNLARDMTYSIAWAAFALILVVVGIWKQIRPARYSGIVLLSITLLKLFFHDLANLQALYRIGALLGVAVIAIAASFFYQHFFASGSTQNQSKPDARPPISPTQKK